MYIIYEIDVPIGLVVEAIVRVFFPFFLTRVTLIGSGVLVRIASSGASRDGNGDIRGRVEPVPSSDVIGVCCPGVRCFGVTALSGISPSLSIMNGVEEVCGGGLRDGRLLGPSRG